MLRMMFMLGLVVSAVMGRLGGLCGRGRRRRVVGGSRTRIGDFPWSALIVSKDFGSNSRERCAGTLINARYVITSASCVSSAQTIEVYLGEESYHWV